MSDWSEAKLEHNVWVIQPGYRGGVSLTFCEPSKIFCWNLCIANIVFLVMILIWNLVRVPKIILCAHVQSFSVRFSQGTWFLVLFIFARLFWRASETLVKQPLFYWAWGVYIYKHRSFMFCSHKLRAKWENYKFIYALLKILYSEYIRTEMWYPEHLYQWQYLISPCPLISAYA